MIISDHGRIEDAGRFESLKQQGNLLLAQWCKAPMGLEGFLPGVGEVGHATRIRNVFERHNLISSATRAFQRVAPLFKPRRPNLDLVVDPTLLRFEAGTFEKPVVVIGILARKLRRQRLAIVDNKRKIHQAESRPSSFSALLFEPMTRRVHEKLRRLTAVRHRLEQDDMTEVLLPMTVVALIDHGNGSRDHLASGSGEKRPDASALGERAFTGKNRQ